MTEQAETYDLFISHADADRAWVEGYLLNVLTQAGVRCHSDAAFVLGVPRLLEFERAVQQSQRTLLVLSPAYLAEGFNQFTDLLAQSYGLETATWPVIPLILHPVKLPPRLAMLTALDATDPALWLAVVERLCAELQRPVPGPAPKPPCPYPGMIPFSEDDSGRFFGRDKEVQSLLERLRLHPFLTVIGPSGSGKSSLVFAGLIPALRKSGLFGPGGWLVRTLRPGETPLAALATALGGDPADPARAVSVLLATEPNARRLLLVVDQFEELFTLAGQDAMPFQETLLRLAETPNCYVVLTIRADFYPDLMATPLWREIQAHRIEVLPLDEDGLRQAIVKPAEDVGVFVAGGLVEQLVADAVGEPGMLPLLQETLVLLWERLERRFLPLSAYKALGDARRTGLQVAMARRADAALAELSPEQQAIARRIFLRLVQFGEGRADTRRQQPVAALLAAGDEPFLFEQTLRHLTDNRLLTPSSEKEGAGRQVDIAHEALITGWPTLQEWLAERREVEQTRRRLEAKAAEWVRLGRGSGGLLDEVALLEAERWLTSPDAADLGYSETLPALVQASRATIEEAKREKEAARQRELEQTRALVEVERQRAEAQSRAARRLRWLVALLALLALVAPGIWSYRQVLRLMARGEMVLLSGGHATIGSAEEVAFDDETPIWSTDVAPFKIERFEVSNWQYRLCVRAGACTEPQDTSSYKRNGLSDYPVVTVTAFQAAAYCRWLERRLPSEVEWEWAARGPEGYAWPWGDVPPDEERINISFGPSGEESLHEVDSHRTGATPDGVFNLTGNVMEWTASPYQLYPNDPQTLWDGNPSTAPVELVIRGGSFMTSLHQARPTARLRAKPSGQREDLGFRCVQSTPQR